MNSSENKIDLKEKMDATSHEDLEPGVERTVKSEQTPISTNLGKSKLVVPTEYIKETVPPLDQGDAREHPKIEKSDSETESNDSDLTEEDKEVLSRYRMMSLLGTGTFADVIKAYDSTMKDYIAIKLIKTRQYPDYLWSVEISRVSFLNNKFPSRKDIIPQMYNSFYFTGNPCIVYELLGKDLSTELMKRGKTGYQLTEIKTVMICVLKTLCCLSEVNLMHCDVKPDNIVFTGKEDNTVKLIDYGNSCFQDKQYGPNCQTLFYRAPEVILQLEFGLPIDMWSLGCIAVEMIDGNLLFKGRNELDQLNALMEVLGEPPTSMVSKSPIQNYFFRKDGKPRYSTGTKKCTNNLRNCRNEPGGRKLDKILQNQPKSFVNFIKRILTWTPEERLTPKEALEHMWIKSEDVLPQEQAHSSSECQSYCPYQQNLDLKLDKKDIDEQPK